MTRDAPTVFIVDDDSGVLSSLAFLMQTIGIPTRTYGSAHEFLEQYDPAAAGCLVLDVRMPLMSGLDLQRKLAEMGCTLPIIFLTAHGDVPMAVKAVQSGAVAFLQKPFHDQELVDRIQHAMAENARMRAQRREHESVAARAASLTPRERQVLDAVVAGKANKVIATELGISQRTVEIHRARVMRKMRADSLAHLIQMMVRAREENGP